MIDCIETVLITGVAGFIGRHTAQYFSKMGANVIGIDTVPQENAPIGVLACYYELKLPDDSLNCIIDNHRPTLCIHCAGRASVPLSVIDPVKDFYANTVLTFNVLNALRLHSPACRFLFLSSAAVYGNPQSLPINEKQLVAPISPYGFHKYQSESIVQEFAKVYGMSTASVRIFSAYGPGLRRQVIWDICSKAISQKNIVLQGTGNESRDFIHIKDIVKALECIASVAPKTGEVYNLASGDETCIHKVAEVVIASLGIVCDLQFDGIVPQGIPLNWRADLRSLSALGYSPLVSLRQGINSYVTWCRRELEGM